VSCGEGALRRGDFDVRPVRLPAAYRAVGDELSAMPRGEVEMGCHAILHRQVAGRRFEDGVEPLGNAKRGPAMGDLTGRESFDLELMQFGRVEDTRHDDSLRRAYFQQATLGKELASRLLFEFMPQAVRLD